MRFRRRSDDAHDERQDESGQAFLPPPSAGDDDHTAVLNRPAIDLAPTTTTVMGDGLRAPNPDELIAPAVWDDDIVVDDQSISDLSGNDLSGNDLSGNDLSGNDLSGNDVTAEVGEVSNAFSAPSAEIDDPTNEVATPRIGGRRDARRWALEDWAAVLIMIALSVVAVDRHVAAFPTLSSAAEVQNIDYADKASHFDIPRPGDALGPVAVEAAVCRGIDGIAPAPDECPDGGSLDPGAVGAYNWEAGARSVPYYFATGMLARFGQWVGLFDNFVDAARWSGAVWLSLGWTIVWYTMLVLGIARRKRAAIVSVFIATPLLIIPATFVGSAASLFFVGALVLLATVKYATGAWSWWSTALIFIVGYLFEPTSAPFEIVYLLFLAALAVRRPSQRVRHLVFPLVSVGALAVLWGGLGGWISHQLWPVIPRPATDGGAADPTRGELVGAAGSGLLPLDHVLYPPFMDNSLTRLVLNVSSWLVSVLVGSVALFGRSSGRVTILARWVLVGLVTAGPLVVWQLAHRYGLASPDVAYLVLPFVAALVVIGGSALVTRSATVVTSLVGLAVIANEIRLLFFL